MAAYGPQPIANIISELMTGRGLARRKSSADRDAAWRDVVGEQLAKHTRCGPVRRGRLEVIVANSTFMQELTLQKPDILTRLNSTMPDMKVEDIKFRVGVLP